MTQSEQAPYTERRRRASKLTVAMIGALFLFASFVFFWLFAVGEFVAGS